MVVTNCMISGNRSPLGGGLFGGGEGTLITIARCTFADNAAYEYRGGAILWGSGRLVLANCQLTGNSAMTNGGAVHCQGTEATFSNCTFAENSAALGRALACHSDLPDYPCRVRATNCVLWDRGDEISSNEGSEIAFAYSDVQGGWPGEGNIDADPLFVDPDDGDFHLGDGSPCIDAGDPYYEPGPDERDIDGQMRLWDGDDDGLWIVDMGSDEFGSIIPGDLDGDGCVGQPDLGILLAAWGIDDGGDLNGDGNTDQADLGILLAHWGEGCP